MGSEFSDGLTARSTMVISKITTYMGKEIINGQTAENTQATGLSTRCTETEFSSGLTEDVMRDNMWMIKSRVMVFLNGKFSAYEIFRPDGRKYIGSWLNGK